MDTLRLHQSRCNHSQRRGVSNRSETPDTIFQHYCRRYSCRRAAATVEIAWGGASGGVRPVARLLGLKYTRSVHPEWRMRKFFHEPEPHCSAGKFRVPQELSGHRALHHQRSGIAALGDEMAQNGACQHMHSWLSGSLNF